MVFTFRHKPNQGRFYQISTSKCRHRVISCTVGRIYLSRQLLNTDSLKTVQYLLTC